MEYRPLPLLDFIPALEPRWMAPRHLAPIAEAIDRADQGPVSMFATTPPRHGKTLLLQFAMVRTLLANPACRIAYCSYAANYANKRSREVRKLYLRAGGRVEKGASLVADWRTGVDEGGFWAAGVGGAFTGEGFDRIFCDDPIKGRAIAESGVERERLWEFFNDDLETRLAPGGSIFVVHTRWTTDDLGGRITSGHTSPVTGQLYEHIRLPAIRDDGTALWPEMFGVEALRRIEKSKGAYTWASLYMGTPFPRGGRVFGDVHFYGGENDPQLPAKLRIAIGIDLAYSAKTSSDYSTLIVLGIDDHVDPPKAYVLHVLREQEKAPIFAARVAVVQEGHPGVPATWYYAGVEKGIIDFVGDMGVDIDARVAAADKFIRSQPVAAAWNAGNVLVPRQSYAAPWVDDFVAELASFTGVKDRHDDQVDALAAAFDSGEQPNWVDAMEKMRARDTAEALTANAAGVCKCRPGLFTQTRWGAGLCDGCGYRVAKANVT